MLLMLREEILCLAVLLFLAFYYSNTKIKEKNCAFERVVTWSIWYVILDAITLITVNNQDKFGGAINDIAHYIFYFLGISVGFSFYYYCINMVFAKTQIRLRAQLGYIPYVLFTFAICAFKLEYVQSYVWYSWGPLAFIAYAIFVSYCIGGLAVVLYHKKRIEDRAKNALTPMIILLFLTIIAQILCPELLLTGGSATILTLGCFIVSDNPDKKYKEQALWDFLTGLRNRNSFEKDMEKYCNRSDRLGLIVADLNRLKQVNDVHGHEEGDEFIAYAAFILKKCLRDATEIYRIGGDEFVALFVEPNDELVQETMKIITKECDQIAHLPVPLEIALGYASGTDDVRSILKRADEAMYAHKQELKQTR